MSISVSTAAVVSLLFFRKTSKLNTSTIRSSTVKNKKLFFAISPHSLFSFSLLFLFLFVCAFCVCYVINPVYLSTAKQKQSCFDIYLYITKTNVYIRKNVYNGRCCAVKLLFFACFASENTITCRRMTSSAD